MKRIIYAIIILILLGLIAAAIFYPKSDKASEEGTETESIEQQEEATPAKTEAIEQNEEQSNDTEDANKEEEQSDNTDTEQEAATEEEKGDIPQLAIDVCEDLKEGYSCYYVSSGTRTEGTCKMEGEQLACITETESEEKQEDAQEEEQKEDQESNQ